MSNHKRHCRPVSSNIFHKYVYERLLWPRLLPGYHPSWTCHLSATSPRKKMTERCPTLKDRSYTRHQPYQADVAWLFLSSSFGPIFIPMKKKKNLQESHLQTTFMIMSSPKPVIQSDDKWWRNHRQMNDSPKKESDEAACLLLSMSFHHIPFIQGTTSTKILENPDLNEKPPPLSLLVSYDATFSQLI